MIALTIAVLTVLVVSALCSGTEAALFSTTKAQAKSAKGYGAAKLREVLEDLTRPVAAIVILNNVANIVGSIVIGALAADVFGSQWLGVFSAVLTLAIIICSEIIPKTLGEQYSLTVSRFMAPSIAKLVRVLHPAIWLIAKITNPITSGRETLTTNEREIVALSQIAKIEGAIEADESEMIRQVFKLKSLTASDIMTHRTMMTTIKNRGIRSWEVREVVTTSQHTRLIVIGDTPDQVLGTVRRDALLVAMLQIETETTTQKVAEHMSTPQEVSEDIAADDLLRFFQKNRQHIAIVKDDFGGVSGVVTLEDVLEVLTGEIVDETDTVVDLQAEALKRLSA